MLTIIRTIAISAIVLCAGCSLQLQPIEQARIDRIGPRLLAAASDFCRPLAQTAADPLANSEEIQKPCDFPIFVSGQTGVYASTNGQRIRINRGMMTFASQDDELAFVIAHEMGHMVLQHHKRLVDADRRQLELEADYIGLYIFARAGYDMKNAVQGVRRLYRSFAAELANHPDYPPPEIRFAALESYRQEIGTKLAQSRTLTPSFQTHFGYAPAHLSGAQDLALVLTSPTP